MTQAHVPASQTDLVAPDDGAPATSNHRWWLLMAMCVAQLMVILDVKIVNIALPDAQRDLGFDTGARRTAAEKSCTAAGQ